MIEVGPAVEDHDRLPGAYLPIVQMGFPNGKVTLYGLAATGWLMGDHVTDSSAGAAQRRNEQTLAPAGGP